MCKFPQEAVLHILRYNIVTHLYRAKGNAHQTKSEIECIRLFIFYYNNDNKIN